MRGIDRRHTGARVQLAADDLEVSKIRIALDRAEHLPVPMRSRVSKLGGRDLVLGNRGRGHDQSQIALPAIELKVIDLISHLTS